MRRFIDRRGVALLIAILSATATASHATVVVLSGGDATDGWVAPANPLFAYNLGGTDQTIQGVHFQGWSSPALAAPANGAGATVSVTSPSATNGNSFYTPPTYASPTANDTAMSAMISTIFYNFANAGAGPIEITMGNLTPGGSYLLSAFTFSDGVSPRTNETFTINGVQTDQFSMGANVSYLVTNTVKANGSGDIVLDVTSPFPVQGTPILSGFVVSAVPEPSSLMLLGLGAALLLRVRRRRA
jgi:hypothetical protein